MASELLWHVHEHVIPAAFDLLPGRMNTDAAKAMLLAIGLQESRFQHRVQIGPGPARGFWQFEKMGGVKGVLTHELTAPIIVPICQMFLYQPTPAVCHEAITHHDTLACVFARLLLWTDPRELPDEHDAAKGWSMYLAQWRPGRPHAQTWDAFFAQAWKVVKGNG